jgi:hypothetical protein
VLESKNWLFVHQLPQKNEFHRSIRKVIPSVHLQLNGRVFSSLYLVPFENVFIGTLATTGEYLITTLAVTERDSIGISATTGG